MTDDGPINVHINNLFGSRLACVVTVVVCRNVLRTDLDFVIKSVVGLTQMQHRGRYQDLYIVRVKLYLIELLAKSFNELCVTV